MVTRRLLISQLCTIITVLCVYGYTGFFLTGSEGFAHLKFKQSDVELGC